jgi:2-polyprenyl-6-hydroxyphenyl methylase/3-demethylubiquinone-9 3-methyltransferase
MEKITFSFGKNWQDFIRTSLTEERVSEAMKSLSEFLGMQRLDGLRFLDIGCGSGLFSLSAYRLGASEVVSFDFDPFSVKCCEYLREREGRPANWSVSEGSILDEAFLSTLGQADIVYSWGVLHHTGRMWQAIGNAAGTVRPGGVLFIAIYNKVDGLFGSQSWLRLKRMYNRVPRPVKALMEYGFFSVVTAKMLLTLRNPVREIREYKKKRGMGFMTDIRDSLGGYPYEYASAEEVLGFCREMGLKLENLKTVSDLGLNEFLFRRPVQKP